MKQRKIVFIILIVLILLIISIKINNEKIMDINDKIIGQTSTQLTIDNKVLNIEIARTPEEHARGLMFREELNENDGMLFIFDDEEIRYFWMKNTLIPLDIIFIDKNKRIINIEHAIPCVSASCENYVSKDVAKYVLEVNGGFSEKNNLTIGKIIYFKGD